jgi:hypothetical protein
MHSKDNSDDIMQPQNINHAGLLAEAEEDARVSLVMALH